MARGHVYCLSSQPGIVKIGATARDPLERLREANACTWSPWPFELVAAAEVPDAWATERLLHALLAARRVNDRREFFALTLDEARALFALLVAPDLAVTDAPAVALPVQRAERLRTTDPVAQQACPQEKLRQWVEANYTLIPFREKDTGTKLEALHTEYITATPPVHTRLLGKILFGKMLGAIFSGIGPHRNSAGTVSGLYLLRDSLRRSVAA
jgi:hypothetical protein